MSSVFQQVLVFLPCCSSPQIHHNCPPLPASRPPPFTCSLVCSLPARGFPVTRSNTRPPHAPINTLFVAPSIALPCIALCGIPLPIPLHCLPCLCLPCCHERVAEVVGRTRFVLTCVVMSLSDPGLRRRVLFWQLIFRVQQIKLPQSVQFSK